MNGGFYPPHGSHQKGVDIDGEYDGYGARDGAAAVKMLDYLRLYGRKIDAVWVAYQKTTCNPAVDATKQGFWCAIKDVVLPLPDGRPAWTVIKPDAGHKLHFHWRLNPALLREP
jgi:hypothetical protein